jgi:hypothetical protein
MIGLMPLSRRSPRLRSATKPSPSSLRLYPSRLAFRRTNGDWRSSGEGAVRLGDHLSCGFTGLLAAKFYGSDCSAGASQNDYENIGQRYFLLNCVQASLQTPSRDEGRVLETKLPRSRCLGPRMHSRRPRGSEVHWQALRHQESPASSAQDIIRREASRPKDDVATQIRSCPFMSLDQE